MYSISMARSAFFITAGHRATIGIDVLPEQRDFADALRSEAGHFSQDVVERAGNSSPRV